MKVTIVGAGGGVGASVAFNLALQQGGHELVLVDSRPEMVVSHAMDLEQVLEQSPGCSVRGGALDDVRDAGVVVLLSSVPLAVGASRLEYLSKNATIFGELAGELAGTDAAVIVVTNHVDPLVTLLQRSTGIDRHRVLGYTVNDSLRFRTGLAKALGAAPGTVQAWVLGEHGDASVPLHGRVEVDGVPVHPTPAQATAAEEYLRTWYVRHVALDSGRSSTWTSGLGVARMVAALGSATPELWPASIVLDGEYGIEGVAVTVPAMLGDGRAAHVVEWELPPGDLASLRASAGVVRAAVDGLG